MARAAGPGQGLRPAPRRPAPRPPRQAPRRLDARVPQDGRGVWEKTRGRTRRRRGEDAEKTRVEKTRRRHGEKAEETRGPPGNPGDPQQSPLIIWNSVGTLIRGPA